MSCEAPTQTDTLSTGELVRLSGTTEMTIHRWRMNGVILPVGDVSPGSGHHIRWDRRSVDLALVLARVVAAVSQGKSSNPPYAMLRRVRARYLAGHDHIDLGDGVTLSWGADRS